MAKKCKPSFVVNGLLVAVIAVTALVCFYPLTSPASALEEEIVRRGDAESDNVSLMFNVYEGTDVVYDILDTLDRYGAKCTFFIGGCWADDNAACLKEILSRGHEIGNHGYFHKAQDQLNYAENAEEIGLCHKVVSLSVGAEMTLFAPPSGAYNEDTLQAAKDLGYKTVLWTRDTVDWRDRDEQVIYARAAEAEGGDLVLMHPLTETAKALNDILACYWANGLTVVTVSENIKTQTT